MVNHDVLKLQVNRLDKILMNRGKELYSLENRKAQLQITIGISVATPLRHWIRHVWLPNEICSVFFQN